VSKYRTKLVYNLDSFIVCEEIVCLLRYYSKTNNNLGFPQAKVNLKFPVLATLNPLGGLMLSKLQIGKFNAAIKKLKCYKKNGNFDRPSITFLSKR
jgi:hypothetical protein